MRPPKFCACLRSPSCASGRAPRPGCMASSPARSRMNNERWNHVDKLLQSTLDRPAAERDAFLRRACSGDEQLELEVRSLLAAHDSAESFLSAPAIDVAARELAGRRGSGDA